jgi:hypothetical protein
MNNLTEKDFYTPESIEDRVWVLEMLKDNGINIFSNTYRLRHDNKYYKEWPNLRWTNNSIVGNCTPHPIMVARGYNILDKFEFLKKAGCFNLYKKEIKSFEL